MSEARDATGPTLWIMAPLLAVLLIAACGGDDDSGGTVGADEARADVERAVPDLAAGEAGGEAVAQFAADLYGALQETPGNLVFSPYSVAIALAWPARAQPGRPRTRSTRSCTLRPPQTSTWP